MLFPVEEHPVFVVLRDESGERRVAAPNKKAIVNTANHRVLGIVSRDYQLVTNQEALEWAYECCQNVFPNTNRAEWDVSATDGPSTGGYCRIDLVHRTAALDFRDVRPGQRPEAFGPFIRVTNSYNGLRALAFDIGFYRKVCRNGLIAPDTIVQFKFAHQRNLEMGIRFEVARDRLANLQTKMSEQFASLKKCTVPRTAFEPMVRAALMIQPAEIDTARNARGPRVGVARRAYPGALQSLCMRAGRNRLRGLERHHRFRITSTQESAPSSRSPRPAAARRDLVDDVYGSVCATGFRDCHARGKDGEIIAASQRGIAWHRSHARDRGGCIVQGFYLNTHGPSDYSDARNRASFSNAASAWVGDAADLRQILDSIVCARRL